MKRFAALCLFAASMLHAAGAAADIPPPDGYVEQCTVEKQCAKDEQGDSCGAYYGDRDKCKKVHASDGYVYRCRTNGASVWQEVWCKKKKK